MVDNSWDWKEEDDIIYFEGLVYLVMNGYGVGAGLWVLG